MNQREFEALQRYVDGEKLTHESLRILVDRLLNHHQKVVEQLEEEEEENARLHMARRMHSINEWHEDNGDVLWWTLPIEEPPYYGSPLDKDWPGYHTHWTPIIIPD